MSQHTKDLLRHNNLCRDKVCTWLCHDRVKLCHNKVCLVTLFRQNELHRDIIKHCQDKVFTVTLLRENELCHDIIKLCRDKFYTMTLLRQNEQCRDIIKLYCDKVFFWPCHDIIKLFCNKVSGFLLALLQHSLEMSRHSFCSTACFSSPTYWGHNFFILTQIWACEVSLESSLNLERNNEFHPFDSPNDIEKFIFQMTLD